MKQMPMIEKFMSTLPHIISQEQSMIDALNLMKEQNIRHLPVENAGLLVGVVSDGDIKLASSLKHAETLKVKDIMTLNPYTVPPHTPVDQVVLSMAEYKYGCTIVKQANGKVVGIFTANDGLRLLGEVLKGNFKPVEQY